MNTKNHSLNRFTDAQHPDYQNALAEITDGKKRGHWMWYIFPQLKGLGFSEMSQYHGISGLQEAKAYLNHPLLGKRLIEICNALLQLKQNNASEIFGSPDDVKLKSSMTLFAAVPGADPVFNAVLDKFFHGESDHKTLEIISK